MAFAGDDVQEEFAAAKAAEVEAELPPVEAAVALPGWGQWAGRSREPAWLVAANQKARQCVPRTPFTARTAGRTRLCIPSTLLADLCIHVCSSALLSEANARHAGSGKGSLRRLSGGTQSSRTS